MDGSREECVPYGFCRKFASVGRGLTGTDAVSILICYYWKASHALVKTAGFGERSLVPFARFQFFRTDERRAHARTFSWVINPVNKPDGSLYVFR